MNLFSRILRRIRRTLKINQRRRQAQRLGLRFIPPNFIFFARFSPDSVIVDAGCSYEADLSRHMMSAYGARAFGVDPTHKHADALHALEQESGGRFTYIQAAIAAQDGTLTFNESLTNESGSIFNDHYNMRNFESRSYQVEALSLPGLLQRLGVPQVDLLKLDLEGAEYDLLNAVSAADLAPFQQIFVEFHHNAVPHLTPADTQARVQRLEGLGLRSFSLDDVNVLFYRD